MRGSLYIILFLILAMPISSMAQSIEQKKHIYQDSLLTNFHENLDSLIHLWYIKNAIDKNERVDSVAPDIPEFSDSVYIARLQNIPSVVELSYNKIVRNYIHVYTKKRRENVQYMLAMADYYFPVFESILEEYGLPTELKYMAIIESALNPRAVSRVGATGIWQFMYGTGRMYDLTMNSYLDERRDPIKSTYAAAQFLSDLYDIFHDWTLVIAAYNCGPRNVSKAIRRTGGKRDFWDIYYYLPRETRGYVPAFIAAAYTMNYYEEHHLARQKIDFPFATDTIMISDNLHLKQVAEVLHIPIQQLRDLNPQYRKDIIPAKNEKMALTIPVLHSGNFIDLRDSIFAYKDSIYFTGDNKIKTPQRSQYVHQVPSGRTKLIYKVKPGDNLGYIAEWYNVRASDLRYWNGIRGSMIRVGQNLAVYVPNSKANYYKPVNSLSFEEKQERIGRPVTQLNEEEETKLDENYEYYKVRSGETIWDIAKKYPGISDQDILHLNNFNTGRELRAGQWIKIKPKS